MLKELEYVCKDCNTITKAKDPKEHTHGIMYSCPECAKRRDRIANSLIDSVFPNGFEFTPIGNTKSQSTSNLRAKLAKIREEKGSKET